MIKSFLERFFSAVISAPLYVMFMFLWQLVIANEQDLLSEFTLFKAFWVTYVFIFPVFFVMGIPMSYLVDFLMSLVPSRSWIVAYCCKLALYVLFTSLVFFMMFQVFTLTDVELLNISLVPALIGFHVLFILRREYRLRHT
ncbi:hypothetical protein KQ939_00055 [Planococcus sp. CP5-4]|uniref:hypothetical protein n=1 Tax=unclassified Planococcus (in: firmicutes) TaxID=2662419 RepID=UPI001C23E621|nr:MULTISPECIES: hypothetical protein [unclassified Planococcus (in: firmicutes)]MBU9675184.1 hypothetical protein [Planococcus sp. CP5-4_YE]MBV0910696.1 hypothetical protein [Planococcus sp. CP5-4_UN]MBW6062093.1 hypothetical protein [Planococcus sp. CP5-4]